VDQKDGTNEGVEIENAVKYFAYPLSKIHIAMKIKYEKDSQRKR